MNWFDAKLVEADTTGDLNILKKAFRNIGLNVNKTVNALQERQQLANGGQETTDLDFVEINNMIVAQAILSIFKNFDLVSDEMDAAFTEYIHTFNGTARADNSSSLSQTLLTPSEAVLDGLRQSSAWVPTSAGLYLVFLAFIAIVNAWVPKRTYRWRKV